jgi:thiamine-monophosphate kinase
MERELVRYLCERLPAHPRLLIGAGDDAAILRLPERANLVATTDMVMEGVDFVLGQHEVERIGRKALAVNLSDLAAMAAMPLAALVSVSLPRQGGEALAKQLYDGMLPLAAEFDCPIAGGDTNSWDGPLVISVTALGVVPPERRWRRSGALAGDAILVTGQFGGSIIGRQFDFAPRVAEAQWLAEHSKVHAAIDVSDGLSLDLARLCEASGCGALLDLADIPVAAAARQLAEQLRDGSTPLDHALSDGEDFELILTMPPDAAESVLAEQPLDAPLTKIGTITREAGLHAIDDEGQIRMVAPRGYEHRLEP